MRAKVLRLTIATGLAAVCAGCGSGWIESGFSIDSYPTLTNTTPITITGTKPSGHAVHVDGSERVAADGLGVWSVELALDEGPNSFEFRPVDPGGVPGDPEAVHVTLDSTPPAVVSRTPGANETGVPINSPVIVVLSEPPDCGTVTAGVFSIVGVASSLTCSPGSPTIRLDPDSNLAPQTQHTVTLFADLQDLAGNPLAQDENWQFTTGADVGPVCGDGTQDAGEECDDGPANSDTAPDACRTNCVLPSCGDTVIDSGEECDDGAANSNTQPDACRTDCRDAHCGDGVLDTGEECDDDNNLGGDGCSAACANEGTPECGDGIRQAGEQCDEGANNSDTRPDACRTDCTNARCGDGVVDSGEDCDDNNTTGGDGCSPLCLNETVPQGSQLKIEFVLQDAWNYIGDEMAAGDGGNNINHFGIDIWVEGPYAAGEGCTFNQSKKQREGSRYVATVSRGCPGGALPGTPCGWWWEPNYRAPNYLAALAEHGQWENSANPMPRATQRRDPATGAMWPPGMCGNQVCHPELYFPEMSACCGWVSKPKMHQEPLIDGVTEPTVDSGQATGTGPALGTWTRQRAYTWNMNDAGGNRVRKGRYLINLSVTIDRAAGLSPHYAFFLEADRETCWDNPAHDTEGMHRVEGIVDFGDAAATVYLREKGHGTVDACKWTDQPNANNYVRCNCSAGQPWPCPATPISDPGLIGGPIELLVPDAFTDPGNGQPYAARIRYCPGGPCP